MRPCLLPPLVLLGHLLLHPQLLVRRVLVGHLLRPQLGHLPMVEPALSQ